MKRWLIAHGPTLLAAICIVGFATVLIGEKIRDAMRPPVEPTTYIPFPRDRGAERLVAFESVKIGMARGDVVALLGTPESGGGHAFVKSREPRLGTRATWVIRGKVSSDFRSRSPDYSLDTTIEIEFDENEIAEKVELRNLYFWQVSEANRLARETAASQHAE